MKLFVTDNKYYIIKTNKNNCEILKQQSTLPNTTYLTVIRLMNIFYVLLFLFPLRYVVGCYSVRRSGKVNFILFFT